MLMSPQRMTIAELSSVLSEWGVQLPVTREKKAVYVALLEALQKRLLREAKKRRSPAREGERTRLDHCPWPPRSAGWLLRFSKF